jgi:hypothetical protein
MLGNINEQTLAFKELILILRQARNNKYNKPVSNIIR